MFANFLYSLQLTYNCFCSVVSPDEGFGGSSRKRTFKYDEEDDVGNSGSPLSEGTMGLACWWEDAVCDCEAGVGWSIDNFLLSMGGGRVGAANGQREGWCSAGTWR